VIFTKRLREGVRRGDITCSVRIWRSPRVSVGKRYAMEEGSIEVDSILPITLEDVTPELARASGFRGVVDLLKVAKHGRGENVYLVRFHYLPPAGPGKPRVRAPRRVTRLAGGNPQIAKSDGDAPVQAYLSAMPEWKQAIGRRLDALVVRAVPGVRKAVKWNSPFYGIEGRGWFMAFHVFARFVKVTFFRGTSLKPPPPGGKAREARWIDVHEDDLDQTLMTRWIKQAAALPGWSGSRE
jgi:hypothetical protein